MSSEIDANPHGFTRDIEVENAAVRFLNLSPEKIKRMRIIDLTEKVKRFVDSDATTGIHRSHRRTPLPTLSEEDEKVMSSSEIKEGPPVVTSGIRMALAEIPEEPDLKGLELLAVPLNVSDWCRQQDGLLKLHNQVTAVLQTASELENAIQRKKELIAQYCEDLDDEDIITTKETIQTDAKQLILIAKWVNAILDDLTLLIRRRQSVQLKFTDIPGGNRVKISSKMQVKTLKMRSLYNAILVRLDCLQIPKLDEPTNAHA